MGQDRTGTIVVEPDVEGDIFVIYQTVDRSSG